MTVLQGARAFKTSVLACIVLAASLEGAAQRITNAKSETRSGAAGLAQEIRTLAARPGVTWVGYRAPMVAGQRQMCCYDTIVDGNVVGAGVCRLESGSGVSMNTGDLRDRTGTRIALEPATEPAPAVAA